MARERDILAALTHPTSRACYDAGVTPRRAAVSRARVRRGRADRRVLRRPAPRRAARGCACSCRSCEASRTRTRKLVVHRDLKPSNILVTAEGQVRLLDFGIAKLLDEGQATADRAHRARRPRRTRRTTPRPSRSRGEPLGIATDVYSLGVVLYELLAARGPTGGSAIRGQRSRTPSFIPIRLRPARRRRTRRRRHPARRSRHHRPEGAEEAPEERYAPSTHSPTTSSAISTAGRCWRGPTAVLSCVEVRRRATGSAAARRRRSS